MIKCIFIFCLAVIGFTPNSYSQIDSNRVILYSQKSETSLEAIASDMYYSPEVPNYESQAADDFTASENWSINQIIISGQYSDTYFSADGFNVYIYSNKNNKPDSMVYFAASQSYSVEGKLFTIILTNPIELEAGNYWISVQSFLNWSNAAYESWSWNQINGNYNVEAKYQSPNSGNCSSWSPVHNCWNVQKTDMYFELYGSLLTSIESEINKPINFALSQNYPNPFNPSTKISWQSPIAGHQTVKVYDVLGNEIAILIDEYRHAGRYEAEFNAANLSSGTYFYQLKVGNFIQTKKMILVK